MIFLAYNFLKYKYLTEENIKYRDWTISVLNLHFPGEDYILPYSQYTRLDLVKKLQCENNLIKGVFFKDLAIIMKYCNKLVFFPTEDNHIGSGVFLEIKTAKKFNIPIYCYNKDKDDLVKSFDLQSTKIYGDRVISNMFYKKVIFD